MLKKGFLAAALAVSVFFLDYTMAPVTAQTACVENFAVYCVKGKRYTLYGIIGTLPANGILVANFTSIHCKPCKKEIPELLGIANASNGKAKLMCIYAESGEPVKENATSLGVMDHAYIDPFGTIQKMFSVEKIPATILFNKKHEIIGRFEGYTEKNIQKIKSHILNN